MLLDLTFQLPAALAWSTSPGKYGTFVQVDAAGLVTVRSYGGTTHIATLARRFLVSIGGADCDIDISSIVMKVCATKSPPAALGSRDGRAQRECHSDGKVENESSSSPEGARGAEAEGQ